MVGIDFVVEEYSPVPSLLFHLYSRKTFRYVGLK